MSDREVLDRTLEQIDRDGTLAEAARRDKQVLLQHLEEQGLLDGTPRAAVDVGWPRHPAVMGLFWEWPTEREAKAWAASPWEVGQGRRQRIVDLAGPFPLGGLVADVVRGAPSVRRSKAAVRVARRRSGAC